MDRPTDEPFDGQPDTPENPTEERDQLALEAAIGALVNAIASAPVPDISERVMARLTEMDVTPSPRERIAAFGKRTFAWIARPQQVTIRIRPAFAVGALALIAYLSIATPFATSPDPGLAPSGAAVAAAAPEVYVQFRLDAPDASHVALAGSFTGWQPEYELRQTTAGTWSILLPLGPGIHDYTFIVDGDEWVADPHALHVADGFGGVNSRIALPSFPASRQAS